MLKDYFVLSQDEAIQNTVRIDRNWIPKEWRPANNIDRRAALQPEDLHDKDQAYNFLVKSDKRNVYPDLLEIPLLLISPVLKDVFCSHEGHLQCNCALLTDRGQREQREYWVAALEIIDCMAEETQFYPNRFIKKLILDRKKIGDRNIFRVKSILEKWVIISSDVVDSILRRPMTGIKLERVDVKR